MRELPLCLLLLGCASTAPAPKSEARTAPVELPAPQPSVQREPEPEGEPEPEPSCDPNAPEGARCGENDARYCFFGKCLKQDECVKACNQRWTEISAHCFDDARAQLCDGDECAPGYTNAATRCAIDLQNGEATCAHLSCGVEPQAR